MAGCVCCSAVQYDPKERRHEELCLEQACGCRAYGSNLRTPRRTTLRYGAEPGNIRRYDSTSPANLIGVPSTPAATRGVLLLQHCRSLTDPPSLITGAGSTVQLTFGTPAV